jgi:hypothetical protein
MGDSKQTSDAPSVQDKLEATRDQIEDAVDAVKEKVSEKIAQG